MTEQERLETLAAAIKALRAALPDNYAEKPTQVDRFRTNEGQV